MTLITIESNSDQTTEFLLHYAEEHGLVVKTNEHRVLTDDDITFGFGRKATDAELTEYLLKTESSERIDIETVFARYID
jgi:hypothetical protein